MSKTKALLLFGALSAFAESCACQTFVGADFEQLAAPSGCTRNATVPPTSAPLIPTLKLPGLTISGGQVLNYANPFQTANNVYYTFNGCAGVQPVITITFDGPASNVNMVIGDIWNSSETVQVQDDRGDNQTLTLSASNLGGGGISLPSTNIRKVTITLPNSAWTSGSPVGFYIDNIACYINNSLNFFDPVPALVSGSGIVTDPQSLATLGTMVRAVAADGVARVVLTAQTAHVGDVVNFSVLDDRGRTSNSVQEDGGIAPLGTASSSRQQSIRVAAQDSTQGPVAFAIYYPPPDFSRGSQDDQSASRNISIQVDPQGPAAAYSRSLTILRPPVLLVHDLWEEPADWDDFTRLINDGRFFIRRASFNNVLGSRITASIPTFQNGNLAHARESALGIAYNSPLLLTQIAQVVNEFRSVQNAAASQADVVVHGIGGVLARASVQLDNYNAPESYSLGNVNKLITVGTPHLGTPFATSLLRNDNACVREILASAGKFSFSNTTVDGSSVSGGIGDIQGNGFGGGLSPALAKIQQGGNDTAPTALIAGLMNNASTNGLNAPLGVAKFIRLACPGSSLASSLTPTGWLGVFGEPSDGMVGFTSQFAGFFGAPIFGITHSEGLEQLGFNPPSELDAQSPAVTAITTLLNTQVRSNSFQPLP